MTRFCTMALALALAGCATARTAPVWIRADGAAVDPQRLALDQTVCQGEMQRASMSGVQLDTGNPFTDGVNGANRYLAGQDVLKGCMAGRGYLLTQPK